MSAACFSEMVPTDRLDNLNGDVQRNRHDILEHNQTRPISDQDS